jgi:hypothetical protein
MSNLEFHKVVRHNSEVCIQSVTSLIAQITNDHVFSTALGENVRKTVRGIGELLSLLTDIPKTQSFSSEVLHNTSNVYKSLHILLQSSGRDGPDNENSDIGHILENSGLLLEDLEIYVNNIITLIDQQLILQNEFQEITPNITIDKELTFLKQKTLGLNFIGLHPEPWSAMGDSPFLGSASSEWASSAKSEVKMPFSSRRPSQQRSNSATSIDIIPQLTTEVKSPLEDSSKVHKFFGDENAGIRKDGIHPWYLKKDVNNDLSYNMEGAVNGGTFSALVEHLTSHEQTIGKISLLLIFRSVFYDFVSVDFSYVWHG